MSLDLGGGTVWMGHGRELDDTVTVGFTAGVVVRMAAEKEDQEARERTLEGFNQLQKDFAVSYSARSPFSIEQLWKILCGDPAGLTALSKQPTRRIPPPWNPPTAKKRRRR